MEGRMEREEKQENFFYEKSAQRPERKRKQKKILSVCTINSHFICKKFGSRQHSKREGQM